MPLFAGPAFFHTKVYTTTNPDLKDFTKTTSGTGAAVNTSTRPGYFSTLASTTGTTTTGASGSRLIAVGGGSGEMWLNFGLEIETLSAVGEEFIIQVGVHNGVAATATTGGIFFRYDRLTSTNWICVSEEASTETTTTTSVAVVEDAQIDLGVYINTDQTSVEYFINDVLLATHTTNLFTSASTLLNFTIRKSAGTLTRKMFPLYASGIVKR